MLVCSSTLWGEPMNSRNSVGATERSRWENLLAASTESSSRNSILATGIPAWSTSTVVSTADLTVGKEHTAATVWEREREREGGVGKKGGGRGEGREAERDTHNNYVDSLVPRPLPCFQRSERLGIIINDAHQIRQEYRWPFTDVSQVPVVTTTLLSYTGIFSMSWSLTASGTPYSLTVVWAMNPRVPSDPTNMLVRL